MLDDPHPVQVSGDDRAGFFRRSEESDPNRHVEAYSWGGLTSRSVLRSLWLLLLPFTLANLGGWMVETDPSKPRGKRQWHAEVQERLIRIISILLTVNFVAWIAALFVDLVAYQCGRFEACREDHWWLGPFGNRDFVTHPQLRIFVGLALTLAVFGLVDFLGRRARTAYDEFRTGTPEAGDRADLTHESFWFRPSLVKDLARLHRACVMLSMAAITSLTLASFESSDARMDFLRVAKVLGAAAILVALSTAALRIRRVKEDKPRSSRALYGLVFIPLVALGGMLWFVWTHVPSVSEADLPQTLVYFRRLPIFLLLAQIALVVVVVVVQFIWWAWQAWRRRGGDRQDTLANACAALLFFLGLAFLVSGSRLVAFLHNRGHVVAFIAAGLAAAVLIKKGRLRLLVITTGIWILSLIFGFLTEEWQPMFVVLAILVAGWWALAIYATWNPTVFRWGGMAVLPLLGAFVLGGVMVGTALRLLDFLDKNDDVMELAELNLPHTYEWFAMAFAGALFLTAVSTFLVYRQMSLDTSDVEVPLPSRWPTGTYIPDTKVDLEDPSLEKAKKSIRKSITTLRMTRSGDILVTWLSAITLIIFVFGMLIALESGQEEDFLERLFEDSYPFITEWEWLRTSSSWLLALLPIAIVFALRSGTKDEGVRRKIGVIWDIGTFWPRRFHPLAPPSYAERAIPELQQRICEVTREKTKGKVETKGKVVLLGHSQGSVVAMATLASLPAQELANIWLVTYGSPLNGIYRRFFPNYFNDKLFNEVANRLNGRPPDQVPSGSDANDAWQNFYRWTDAISAPIGSRFNDPPDDPDSFANDRLQIDKALFDPWWWWLVRGQSGPEPLNHSNYLDDPVFTEWVTRLPAVGADQPGEATATSPAAAPSSTPGQA